MPNLSDLRGQAESAVGEHSTFDSEVEQAGDFSQNIAATMLASKLGIGPGNESGWPEQRKSCLETGKISKIFDITQVSEGDKNGAWTTTVAVAVFVL